MIKIEKENDKFIVSLNLFGLNESIRLRKHKEDSEFIIYLDDKLIGVNQELAEDYEIFDNDVAVFFYSKSYRNKFVKCWESYGRLF